MNPPNIKQDTIVVRSPCCGGVISAAANKEYVFDDDYCKEIIDWIKQGCSVEHWSREKVKSAIEWCKCGK